MTKAIRPYLNCTLLYFLRGLHYAVLLFVLLGWLVSLPVVWIIHLIFVPALVLHWKTNEQRCFLSDLEKALFNSPVIREERSPFIKHVLRLIIRRTPSDRFTAFVIYGAMLCSWTISLLRLMSQ